MKLFFLILIICLALLPGCTAAQVQTAKDDFHTASTAALGLVTAAANNPALVAEAKAALSAAAAKAAPKDVDAINQALAHVNAGNLAQAQTILTTAVAASAPATTDANTTRTTGQ